MMARGDSPSCIISGTEGELMPKHRAISTIPARQFCMHTFAIDFLPLLCSILPFSSYNVPLRAEALSARKGSVPYYLISCHRPPFPDCASTTA